MLRRPNFFFTTQYKFIFCYPVYKITISTIIIDIVGKSIRNYIKEAELFRQPKIKCDK